MFKNYFTITLRSLWKNKVFSAINISGLAVGMASAIMILLWIQNEITYDKFHINKDRIYETWNKVASDGELRSWSTTPKILARTLERDIPEVERVVRVNWPQQLLLTVGDKKITRPGNAVDTGFFDMFSFPLISGNPKTALTDPHSIVITEKLSKALFNSNNAIGKVIKVDNKENYTVTAVAKDPPNNTRFVFECLLPWEYIKSAGNDDSSWSNNSTKNYVLLKKNVSFTSAAVKIKPLRQKYDSEARQGNWEIFLYPLDRWRLYSSFTNGKEDNEGRIGFVKLFGTIGVFVLLVACINFMNLSTARSEKRAKELGIRKVIGARKISLIHQFIGESILVSLLAAILATIIVELSLPAFNELIDKQLFIDYSKVSTWIAGTAFIIFTGLLAGSYPAFFLSSFQPAEVLKGTFKKVHALITPRKVFVVFQFSFAIILIICTIILKQQIDYGVNRETGYEKKNLVYHHLTGDLRKNYALVKNELLSTGIAVSVVKTSSPLTESWSDGSGQAWEGKDPNDKTAFSRYSADQGLGKVTGFKFVQGRDFDLEQFPTDSTGMIINESAWKVVKFKDPIGKIIRDNDINWHIVGVIKDFIMNNPYEPTTPMLISGAKSQMFNTILIRLNANGNMKTQLEKFEAIFRKYNPEYPFEYIFVDEEYAAKFRDEQSKGTLAAIFAGLTIFISCLGLFGLAAYMAENRTKEIGIRKILGASITGITMILSSDFIKLVLIAFVIAAPIAWWAMYYWLQDYTYRVPIYWWVFALAGLSALLIALITVSFQAIKAAIANPVKSLRTE